MTVVVAAHHRQTPTDQEPQALSQNKEKIALAIYVIRFHRTTKQATIELLKTCFLRSRTIPSVHKRGPHRESTETPAVQNNLITCCTVHLTFSS